MGFGRKVRLGLSGVPVPRPANVRTPADVGLPFDTVAVPVGDEELEGWHVPHPTPKGVVVMGPGYLSAKDSLLPEAKGFHDLGYAVLLIDFRGAGGSPRADVTLGVREGEDTAAVRFARRRYAKVVAYASQWGRRPC